MQNQAWRRAFWLLVALVVFAPPVAMLAFQPPTDALRGALGSIPAPQPVEIRPRLFVAYGALVAASTLGILYLYRGRPFVVYWIVSWSMLAASYTLNARGYADVPARLGDVLHERAARPQHRHEHLHRARDAPARLRGHDGRDSPYQPRAGDRQRADQADGDHRPAHRLLQPALLRRDRPAGNATVPPLPQAAPRSLRRHQSLQVPQRSAPPRPGHTRAADPWQHAAAARAPGRPRDPLRRRTGPAAAHVHRDPGG